MTTTPNETNQQPQPDEKIPPALPGPRRSKGIVRRVLALQMSGLLHSNTRTRLLRYAGIILGKEARVLSDVFFSSEMCEIGDHSFINQGCHIDVTGAWVRIGKHVQIGPHVKLITSSHEIAGPECRAGRLQARPVTIGDGCWIGAASTILPGVTIAPGCVIGAGAVVTKNTEPNGLYVGTPAILLRRLP